LPYPSLLILLFSISKLRALHFSCNVVFEYLNSIGKIFLMVVSIFFVSNVEAQINLVQNPSFEEIDICPTGVSQINRALNWGVLQTGGGGNPDLYHTCCTNSNCGVPINANGASYQIPKSGNAYAGIDVGNQNGRREYTQSKLFNLLDSGHVYCVKFYTSLYNTSRANMTKLGVYLDDGTVLTFSSFGLAYLDVSMTPVPSQVFNMNNPLDDTLNWVLIEGSFTALGFEEFITIGNFFPDSLAGFNIFNPFPNGSWFSYYYIDDISVIDISTPADAGEDVTITAGDSVYLGRPSEIGLDEACVWFLNGIPIDTVAGIMVAPDSSTTYILQQTICGNVQYDSVTVTVDKGTGISTLNKKDHFEVYPNPNNGDFVIKSTESGYALLFIYSIDGKLVYQHQIKDISGERINLLLNNGLYLISIRTEKKLYTTKLTINNQ
jgi:hypothetical protein